MRRPKVWLSIIMLVMIAGCSSKTKTQEYQSGRLKYVKTLKYGSVGTHGSKCWYVSEGNFYVNEKRWSPDGIKVEDIAGCEPSPTPGVEALKCYSFADLKESVFVLRMKADKAEWVTVSDASYGTGDNLGEWVGEGRWLILKDYFFNVATSERTPVKGLPDYPGKYFRAASPDRKTVIYEEYCFSTRLDLPPGKERDTEIEKQCQLANEHRDKGLIALWLINSETGAVTIVRLKKEKYPSLVRSTDLTKRQWIENLRKLLVWEKDEKGQDRMVYPNES